MKPSLYAFWIAAFILILARYLSVQPDYKDGDRIRITAKVNSEPIKYDTAQYLKLEGLKIYLPLFPEVSYSDTVVVEGVVSKDKLKDPDLVEIRQNKGMFSTLRKRLIAFYKKSLPEPHASLIAGVTIGSKSDIPDKFWEQLKISGTAHVVVASGMNVTLVAGFLVGFLVLFLPRKRAIYFALLGVWSYAIISGFDAPIIRAAIMGSIGFAAQAVGRVNIAWRALVLSALIMLFVYPMWLVDLGFILSFVATASLMLFEKRVYKKLKFIPEYLSVFKKDLSTSFSAQIGVAPILYVTFGQFNIISPLINALVLWTIAPITIIGMIAGIVSLLWIQLGKLIIYLGFPLSSWFVGIIKAFG